ncbi:hypothetical protein AFUB_021170 [Aspergillus fumigatus A1163]|uniref:Uncharacterized protein n=1 Tax=Aspergillus fumigatus (strain CBS 144.89 / FGSC A1163 / CEA10) TaxID=451804 RepID=B0XUT2_ASPFC|nr:hypothetical protein AFUB_021170 [Aspergillus fumigatus A1163]
MDAKNPYTQPTACSPAGGHEQVLPMLGKPAAWDSAIPTTSNTSGGTIFNNYNYPHHHHQQQQPQLVHHPFVAVSSAGTTTVPAVAPSSSSLSHNPDESVAAASRSADSDSKNRQDVGKGALSKLRKTRKTTNASNGRSTLFWVHTDPQSVSEGTREETLKRIRSHVMSEHNRKKRLENTKRYKSKTWKHLAFQPVETTSSNSSSATAASAPAPSSASSSPAFEQNTTTSSPTIPSTQHDQRAEQEHDQGQPQIKEEEGQFELAVTKRNDNVESYGVGAPSQTQSVDPEQSRSSPPWDGLGQGGKDPFNTLHTPLSDRMYRHLQHSQTSPLILDTFHHRGETIRLVNESLSDPLKASSDELIAAVSILLTIEV